MYKINDLSKLLGVTTNTIRRYEKDGYISPRRDNSNYRFYSENDILKISSIMLLRKCGFSHSEIKEMTESSSDDIIEICNKKLIEMDLELNRLKHLRHWLKDNIKLMRTSKELKDDFIIMDCIGLKYIEYSKGSNLLTEKERLKTVESFIYKAPEVQMVQLYYYDDLIKGNYIKNNGWAMKIIDVEKFELTDIINNNNVFIKTYEVQKCIYYIFETKATELENLNGKEIFEKGFKYLEENGFTLNGDIMCIVVNAVNDVNELLISIPIK